MADVWEELEQRLNGFVSNTKMEVENFKTLMKNEIEAAKQDVVLTEIRNLNRRLDTIEERLTEKEQN